MPPQKNLIDYYADRLEQSFKNSVKIGNRVATFDIAAFKNVIFKIAQSSGLPDSYGGAQDAF